MSDQRAQRSSVDLVRRSPPEVAVAAPQSQRGVHVASIAELPTRFGHFRIVAFRNEIDGKEPRLALKGNLTLDPMLGHLLGLWASGAVLVLQHHGFNGGVAALHGYLPGQVGDHGSTEAFRNVHNFRLNHLTFGVNFDTL